MKKTVAWLLVAALLVLCGCQGGGSGDKYGIILTNKEPYQKKILEGFQTAAESLGATVIVKYADSLEEQISALEDLQEAGVKGIALRSAEAEGLRSELRSATFDGIPVVTVDMDTDGSQFYINPSDTSLIAHALLETAQEIIGGQGNIAVLADSSYSGSNPYVNSLQQAIQNEKYNGLFLEETAYCSVSFTDEIQEKLDLLIQDHPDLKVILCLNPIILQHCAQALKKAGSDIQVIGLGNPAQMEKLVGNGKNCPCFFFWNPAEIGQAAAYTLAAVREGSIAEDATTFTGKNGKEYPILSVDSPHAQILVGGPFRFDEENVAEWAKVYK